MSEGVPLDNSKKYWKEFLIEEVFDISTGATISQKDLKDGNIPRITVSDNNNGVSSFTIEENNKNFRTLENFISISFLGSVFYHPYKASLDMKVHAIKPKNFQFNRYIATFLINLLKNFTQKYSYGYQLSTSILKKQKIILPVDKNENPDWKNMENYMKNIEEKTLKEVVKYFEKRLKIAENSGGRILLDKNINWGEFLLKDLFILKLSSGDNQARFLDDGKIPLVSSGMGNNGICKFILAGDGKGELFNKYSITIDMFGKPFFHSYYFFAVSHGRINILEPKDKISDFSAKFLVTIIEKNFKNVFSYNRMCSQGRLKRTKILLPVDNFGKPNYEFMENYMRIIEQKKILEYLKNIKV